MDDREEAIEREKLRIGRFKAWWTGVSVLVSVLIGASTVTFRVWGPVQKNLIEFAFSGAGVRGATFNLSVLQAFLESRLLRKFDYLSTVSGGGYIGTLPMGDAPRP